ncbi:hypothetical protein MOVS_04800 [Moraxella ovis]|uniref:Uncharacterized protein n=1 Tax=Moraxella ovis TaxID=29433 RepID=A0ABM6BCL8_9GAMM|nr:hypothetical protein [Moraxella ovis]ANB91408.1 hypothetical protein MOVS_04800 [Moraxella ovis]
MSKLDTTTNELINNLSHKLAAGLTGCLSAKDKSCEAGAVGAIIGEMVGDWMVNDHEIITPDGDRILVLSDHDKQQILNTAKLTAGSVVLLCDAGLNFNYQPL